MSVHQAPAPNKNARSRRVRSRKDADWFVTPSWATEALLERAKRVRALIDTTFEILMGYLLARAHDDRRFSGRPEPEQFVGACHVLFPF